MMSVTNIKTPASSSSSHAPYLQLSRPAPLATTTTTTLVSRLSLLLSLLVLITPKDQYCLFVTSFSFSGNDVMMRRTTSSSTRNRFISKSAFRIPSTSGHKTTRLGVSLDKEGDASVGGGCGSKDPASKSPSTGGAAADDDWLIASFERSRAPDRVVIGPQEVLIYDTSLRDGTQGESVSVSCLDKLKIARRLSSFNVDYIECGWPGSNPKDAEFFSRAATELDAATRAKLVAFGSTRRKNMMADADPQVEALLESGAPTVCIVGKGHLWQVEEILRATPRENADMIADTVSYLVEKGRRVFVDLEHFFDGFKYDEEYALECCAAAATAGASGLVLCDTNGGSMPWDIERMTRVVRERFPSVTVGIHCHNDCGMAVANSLSAVRAGAGMVQGTINGIGERTGNADLCSIVPSLALHVNASLTCRDQLEEITKLSRFVDETLNRNPNPAAPFVGMSAFAHKGGLHVSAMERNPLSYQHIEPDLVGNEKRILISELSGRQNIMDKIQESGVSFGEETSERALAILKHVKRLESIGYTFEGADASVHLMILHASKDYCPPFMVLDYSAQVFDSNMDSASRILWKETTGAAEGNGDFKKNKGVYGGPSSRATVKVRTMDSQLEDDYDTCDNALPYTDRLEVSDGNGPVDALASALLRALLPSYSQLKNVELVDYKVRILDPSSATGAATRVMVEFMDKETDQSWTTVSVDTNVISASLNALVDGFEYALLDLDVACLLEEEH